MTLHRKESVIIFQSSVVQVVYSLICFYLDQSVRTCSMGDIITLKKMCMQNETKKLERYLLGGNLDRKISFPTLMGLLACLKFLLPKLKFFLTMLTLDFFFFCDTNIDEIAEHSISSVPPFSVRTKAEAKRPSDQLLSGLFLRSRPRQRPNCFGSYS